jgi:hypothetical protein
MKRAQAHDEDQLWLVVPATRNPPGRGGPALRQLWWAAVAEAEIFETMNFMTAALSVVSFALAAIAYWRSGGKRDAEKLRREVDVLRAKQKEFVESASQALTAAYERSRQRLQSTRESLRRLKSEAREGLQTRLNRAEEQLEALAARLEAAVLSAKDATVGAGKKLKESIKRRVHRIEARARLMEAWDSAALAVIAAEKNNFDRAEHLLCEASELLHTASHILEEDHIHNEQLDVVKKALRTATIAVRGRAADARQRIEQVVAETDCVVSALESDEEKAAEETRPSATPTQTSNPTKQKSYDNTSRQTAAV